MAPSNSHRLLFAIVVTIESEDGSFPIVQCQPASFFFNSTGESAFQCGVELGMSRALLSEVCESDESWQCLPPCLGKGTMRMP